VAKIYILDRYVEIINYFDIVCCSKKSGCVSGEETRWWLWFTKTHFLHDYQLTVQTKGLQCHVALFL